MIDGRSVAKPINGGKCNTTTVAKAVYVTTNDAPLPTAEVDTQDAIR